jgi:predicted nucleotidyltransferase
MTIDLTFVASPVHRRLLSEALADLRRDEAIIGVLLAGSLARGDALPGSDIDLYVLLRDGRPKTSFAVERDGILVERMGADEAAIRQRFIERPMSLYTYLDGRILHDPAGRLADLTALARQLFDAYRTSEAERQAIAYWLASVRRKLAAARAAGDERKAAYLATTTAWKIMEGLWAANDRPVPPSGAVWPHLGDLADEPSPLVAWLDRLVRGSTPERLEAAAVLMDSVIPRLAPVP